jgi:DNA-binding MarR family transcriptional regulator
MPRTGSPRRAGRAAILARLARVGRENSDATVIFHATMARLLGLHPTDYKTLGLLERLGPLSAGEIAARTGLATASVTNLVDRLEAKGFVRRVRGSADRRRVSVEPVAERLSGGRRRFASARRSLARLFDAYLDQELSVIADFLSRNAARLREETRKLEYRKES